MSKLERQNLLMQLIDTGGMTSQAQLVSQLRRAGHTVTQASVSRDLDEVGASKNKGVYTRRRNSTSELGKVTFEATGGCLVVGRCASGLASAITVRIDQAGIVGIVGTIAGDDTIFIAVRNNRSQVTVLQGLTRLFG